MSWHIGTGSRRAFPVAAGYKLYKSAVLDWVIKPFDARSRFRIHAHRSDAPRQRSIAGCPEKFIRYK
jgi:hypothetical protein